MAKYWKNGTVTSLTDGTRYAEANAIQIIGNDVYVAGYEEDSNYNSDAKYWKNGTGIKVGTGNHYSFITGICIVEK